MDLPSDIYKNIALFSPLDTILSLCKSNTIIRKEIDTNEYFWGQKMTIDYPHIVYSKPSNLTWKKAYIGIVRNKLRVIPVIYETKIVSPIWIKNTDKQYEIYRKIVKLIEGNISSMLVEIDYNDEDHIIVSEPYYFPYVLPYSDNTLKYFNNIGEFKIVSGNMVYGPPNSGAIFVQLFGQEYKRYYYHDSREK